MNLQSNLPLECRKCGMIRLHRLCNRNLRKRGLVYQCLFCSTKRKPEEPKKEEVSE